MHFKPLPARCRPGRRLLSLPVHWSVELGWATLREAQGSFPRLSVLRSLNRPKL
jgi:hypothetical protein